MVSPGKTETSYVFIWLGHVLIIPAEGKNEQKHTGTFIKPEPQSHLLTSCLLEKVTMSVQIQGVGEQTAVFLRGPESNIAKGTDGR